LPVPGVDFTERGATPQPASTMKPGADRRTSPAQRGAGFQARISACVRQRRSFGRAQAILQHTIPRVRSLRKSTFSVILLRRSLQVTAGIGCARTGLERSGGTRPKHGVRASSPNGKRETERPPALRFSSHPSHPSPAPGSRPPTKGTGSCTPPSHPLTPSGLRPPTETPGTAPPSPARDSAPSNEGPALTYPLHPPHPAAPTAHASTVPTDVVRVRPPCPFRPGFRRRGSTCGSTAPPRTRPRGASPTRTRWGRSPAL